MTHARITLPRVIAGVDGTEAGWTALGWAARDAHLTGSRLHVVTAAPAPPVPSAFGRPVPPASFEPFQSDLSIIDEARKRVLKLYHDVEVSGAIDLGTPSAALVRESRNARRVVVGWRGHTKISGMLLGSTALHVALHGTCPVVVVRQRSRPGTRRPFYADSIVVGVDGSEGAHAALSFAFEEAALRQLPVTAVLVGSEDAGNADSYRELLSPQLRPYFVAYPEVTVNEVLLYGRVVDGLCETSSDAEMVVVGSRGHGGFAGFLLGSVSLALLQRAQCPVVVVQAPRVPSPVTHAESQLATP